MNKELAIFRKEIYKRTRNFFDNRDFLEVDTPLLAPTLIPESSIDNFKTQYKGDKRKDLFLIPSCELYIKRLLKEWQCNLYQINHCFRNSEGYSNIHEIEFSMLEFYLYNKDDNDSLTLCLQYLKTLGFKEEAKIFSMNQLFIEKLNLDLTKLQDLKVFKEKSKDLLLSDTTFDTWESLFNKLFLTYIEEDLPSGIVVIKDYPKQIRSLSQNKDAFFSARWELYINRIEIANCFYELSREEDMINLFKEEYSSKMEYKLDLNLAKKISKIGKSSGVAIGMDRLLMALKGLNNIQSLILFPISDTLFQRGK